MLQRSPASGEGGGNACGTLRFETRESEYVHKRIAVEGDRDIVAAVCTLQADMPRNPPDAGVVEERCLGDALQDVDQVIMTADVGQFMREQSFDVFARHAGTRAGRDE